jgi:hypothetical protein
MSHMLCLSSSIVLCSNCQQDEDVSNYLPPGWTEEKLETHTTEDFMALASDVSCHDVSGGWLLTNP